MIARPPINRGWSFTAAWRELQPQARRLAFFGAAACILALVFLALGPSATVRPWLAAAFLWSAVPIGSVMILMMMRLIPGIWNNEMMLAVEAAAMLLPLAALLFVPVLLSVDTTYPWAQAADHKTSFRAIYFVPSFFALRTVIWFATLGALTALLIVKRTWSAPVSCLGLVFFALAGTVVTTDWVMSLDPDFRSSGFGLYAMSVQVTIAMSAAVLASLSATATPMRKPQVLGGLLLTTLLLWAYLSYMQFVVIWSSDFPPLVHWYLRRAGGGWGATFWTLAILQAIAIALLILPPLLKKPRVLQGIAIVVLLGKVLESAWLILPTEKEPLGVLEIALFVVAIAGMGALFAVGFQIAFRARLDARRPKPEQRLA